MRCCWWLSFQVSSAKSKASDDQGCIIITITGNNLLFLRELVKLNGCDPCETIVQTDSQLVITAQLVTSAVSVVIVKTAFGQTMQVIEQVSHVCDMCFFTSVNRIDLEIVSSEPLNMCIGICMWNTSSEIAFSMYKSKPTDSASNLSRACTGSSKNLPLICFIPTYCH